MALRTAVTLGNKQFLKSIDQMERKMGGFNAFMHRSSLKFAAGAGIIGAGLALSVKAAADFEQSMANMDSVAKTTGEEFGRLKNLAYEMSTTTTRSATEAATAMYELASAGQRAEQIYSTLPSVIKLADATQFDLSQTTSTVVSTMNAFGLTAADTERIVNVMAASIGGSLAKMDKLSASFAYIGPVAKSAGLSIEETSAALMVLYNAGLDGSAAGTSLRRILASLLDPTESLKVRIKDLELSLSAVDPRLHSMSEIMQVLKDAGLEAASAFQDFGLRGAPALLALLEAGDGLDEFEGMVTGTNTAAEMLARQMDTVAAQGKILKNTLVTLGIKIGEKLLPMVRRAIEWLKDLMAKFDGMSDAAFELTAKIGLTTAGTLALLAVIGRMAPVLGAATGPLGLLALAIGLVVSANIKATRTLNDYYDALREGDAVEAASMRSKAQWAAMLHAALDPGYWRAVGVDIGNMFIRLGAGIVNVFEQIKSEAVMMGEALNPVNWIDPEWRARFAEELNPAESLRAVFDAMATAPIEGDGLKTFAERYYDALFLPPADLPAKIAATLGAAVGEALEEGITMPTGVSDLAEQIGEFYALALAEGWDAEETQRQFLETFGAIEAMADHSSAMVAARFRAASDAIQDQMSFAADALTSFMVDVGESLEENLKKEKSFVLAMVKTVGKAYADLVEKFAMKAVTNTLMAQAETVGILSMQGLFDWSAWAKIGPAIAKGAATIALIKAIKGRLGFHTGGPNYEEGFKFLKSNELVMDRSTVQRGGYGRATLDAAGEVGMGTNVTVNVNIANATMTNPEVDARVIAQIIGDEVEAMLNGGA